MKERVQADSGGSESAGTATVRAPLHIAIKGGIRLVVPSSLELMTPYVLREQEDWFEDETDFVRALIKPGMQALDIGANYGVYALIMATAVGGTGQVWAFEPAPETASYLRESIAANELRTLTLFETALSNRDGEAKLSVSSNTELNSLSPVPGARETQTVQLTTLDSIMERLGHPAVDFVKLDAEGEEFRILEGAERFLAEQSPLFMYELKHGSDVNLPLVQAFETRGYRTYRLIPGLGILTPFDAGASVDAFLLNLFCCKEDRAIELEQRQLLARAIPETAEASEDTELWAKPLSRKPFASGLLPTWTRAPDTRFNHDQGEYKQALNDYFRAHDENRPPAERISDLYRSLVKLEQLVTTHPRLERLLTLARLTLETGERAKALAVLDRLTQQLTAPGLRLSLQEPFLPPSARYEGVTPDDKLHAWCLSSVLEQREKSQAFSSYFVGAKTLQNLNVLHALGFAGSEIERRRQLVMLRSGMQKEIASVPLLSVVTADNLNPELWCTPQQTVAAGQTSGSSAD